MAYTTQEMRDDVAAMVLSAEDDMLHGPFDYWDFYILLPVMTDAGILFDTSDQLDPSEPGSEASTAYKIASDSVCEIEVGDAFKELHEQVLNASAAQVKRYAVWLSGCVNRSGGCELYDVPFED